MKVRPIVLLFCILFLYFNSLKSQSVKGLYVDGFSSILNNTVKEDSLLNYAKFNGFNYLALYDLWPIHVTYNLTNASSCTVLANFIQRAKQNFGITQVGAVGENFYFFNNVIKIYNQQHTNALQKFNVYNVEFEFWNETSGDYYCTTYLQPNGYACDTAGAFKYYKKLILQVDSLGNITGVTSETYVGWFNQGQAVTIANSVDRILLHDYISNYSSLYSYIKPRLQYIAARNVLTDVIPIFSAEPSFMGPWLSSHTVSSPYVDLQTALANETGSWKQYINLKGYQWFAYSFMPYNVLTAGVLEMNEEGDQFFPNPASECLTIKIKNQKNTLVTLTNNLGQTVLTQRSENNSEISLNLSSIVTGIYFCTVQTDTKTVIKKIVIR
jgi:hypothetical protein